MHSGAEIIVRMKDVHVYMERPRGLSVAMDLKNNPGTKYRDSIPSTFYVFPRTV